MQSIVKIGDKSYDLNKIKDMEQYLEDIVPILEKVNILKRFDVFNMLLRGIELKMYDTLSLSDYSVKDSHCDIQELDPNIKLKQHSHKFEHPLVILLRFVYENFPGCKWPTAGILGAVNNGVFKILSFGANESIDIMINNDYFIDEVGKNVKVEFVNKGLSKRAKTCPRKLVPECTTGKCYGACASVCHQMTHTERSAVLRAGLGRISNIDKYGSQTFVVESFKYQGEGDLTLLFLGHWWFCRPCCEALVGAGIKNIILLSPERFKTWNWQGDPLKD